VSHDQPVLPAITSEIPGADIQQTSMSMEQAGGETSIQDTIQSSDAQALTVS